MKMIWPILVLITLQAHAQQKSKKQFDAITLVNRVSFHNAAYDIPRAGNAFLFKYQNDTFAVTAKDLIWRRTPPEMKSLVFDGFVKNWNMLSPATTDQSVVIHRLINANPAELLQSNLDMDNDFLVFSIKENRTHVKPVEARITPLNFGEKLFVVGYTDTASGAQQVYEFQYRKMTGRQVVLSERILSWQFASLSGAPVLDEQGLLVGIASCNPNVQPAAGIYFAMCTVDGLLDLVKADKKE